VCVCVRVRLCVVSDVLWSVCVLVATMSCAHMAELTKMLFGCELVWAQGTMCQV